MRGATLRTVVSPRAVEDPAFSWLSRWQDMVPLVGAVVECVSPAVARELVIPALEAGKAVIPASVGAFSDDACYRVAAAGFGGGRLIIPAGAVGGMDFVDSASIGNWTHVQLTNRKPLGSLGLHNVTEPTEVFRGSAREVAERYPQNLNVARTLALYGLGSDQTELVLIPDPNAVANTHTVVCQADAGRYELTLANLPDPRNPKTSLLASYSIVACLKSLVNS